MDVIVNAEFGGKLRESAACLLLLLLRFICSIWCLTQYPARKKNPTHVWAEEKPRILSVLKFDSEVQDPGRQKANGGGGQADRQQADRRTSVSENSPNNLQPPTEVSPFVWLLERGACTKGPILITLLREIRTAEWTWDIRFQISLLWFVCAHRFNAHAGLVCVIYHQNDPLPAAQALREGCWAGFSPLGIRSLHIAPFARFHSEVRFPPSSWRQGGHNCALYMVKSSFVWRMRLAAPLACKVLRPRLDVRQSR